MISFSPQYDTNSVLLKARVFAVVSFAVGAITSRVAGEDKVLYFQV